MVGEQLLVGLCLDSCQCLVVLLHRTAADILVVHEVGGGSYIKCSGGGVGHVYLVDAALYLAVGLYQDAALSCQARLDAFLLHTVDNGSQLIDFPVDSLMLRDGKDFRLQLGREINVERQRALLAGPQLDDNHIVGQRGEDRTLVFHALIYIRCGGGGIAQVQCPAVFVHVCVAQLQLQAAHREEAHAVRAFDEVLVEQLGGLALLALEDELPHLRQFCQRLRTVVRVGAAAPEGLLVQLDFLGVSPAIDHGSQRTVADGQCFEPVGGRIVVPKRVLLCLYRLPARNGDQEDESAFHCPCDCLHVF